MILRNILLLILFLSSAFWGVLFIGDIENCFITRNGDCSMKEFAIEAALSLVTFSIGFGILQERKK
jgi:hypothetical protein